MAKRSTNSVMDINAAFASVNPDHHMEFRLIDYTIPEIDTSIQRDEVIREINRISGKKFNPAAIGVLTVSVREVEDPETGEVTARWFLVDGQQRRASLARIGFEHQVPAIVHYGLTKDEEAQLFLDLNAREGVGAWARFKARLQAKEEQALAIKEMLDDLDIPLGVGGFQAIAQADRIYSRGERGPANLRFALSILREIYEEYDGRVLGGLGLFYNEYHQFVDVESFREKLGRFAPTLIQVVRAAKTIEALYGGKADLLYAEALVNFYNRRTQRGARGGKRLPSLFLGRKFKPAGGDLEELAAMRADAADEAAREEFDTEVDEAEVEVEAPVRVPARVPVTRARS